MENLKLIDELITGMVEPHIYAFKTNTIPNYLKVGDTYRPVEVRLEEWKSKYNKLEEVYRSTAKVDDDVYFRDYSVHDYLIEDLHKERLNNGKDSIEFFKNTNKIDVEKAIKEINKDYANVNNNKQRFRFYNLLTTTTVHMKFKSSGVWTLKPLQENTVNAFKEALKKGKRKLLMFAVMRFGKSFTAMSCAKEMANCNIIVVLSAKKDVLSEWQKTVESPENFRNDYEFIDSDILKNNYSIINELRKKGKKVVVFATFQVLNSKDNKIKEEHRQLFDNPIDLLIVDETHFGAHGQVFETLYDDKYKDDIDEMVANEKVKAFSEQLNPRVELHLSGTPYRLLMQNDFDDASIIAKYQYIDMMNKMKEWDDEHLNDDKFEEWDNPYYGLPQMIRFAFNLNDKSIKLLEKLKQTEDGCNISSVFKPIEIENIKGHDKFVHEKEVLDLLQVIDGSKSDKNVFSFLNYKKIKNGSMCRHMVFVFPYKSSCDAMEKILVKNKNKFVNLNSYEIINISGHDSPYNNSDSVKNKIASYDNSGRKTISLTVNKMLTGSTVEEWDTMVMFKSNSSPQEYDQATFRIQNQHIKEYIDEKSGKVLKVNLKPQTLLVDFDPIRMFKIEEESIYINNAIHGITGLDNIKSEMKKKLDKKCSPIICVNNNKLKEVKETDIISLVSDYAKNRSISDLTNEIPVDLTLLSIPEIAKVIENEHEIGSRWGFKTKANEGEENNITIKEEDEKLPGGGNNDISDNLSNNNSNINRENTELDPEKQFRTYYAKILYFAFLTNDVVASLKDTIKVLDKNANNIRIASNIFNVDKQVIKSLITVLSKINDNMKYSKLPILDKSIERINLLSKNNKISPIEKALTANDSFGKLSESEVVTPNKICKKMVDKIPNSIYNHSIKTNAPILDLASKKGEFAIALVEKYTKLGYKNKDFRNLIYAIPTSKLAYEFTRKVYEILDLNAENISSFTSIDLLKFDNKKNINYKKIASLISQNNKFCDIDLNEDIKSEDVNMKFDAVISNPPYQVESESKKIGGQPPRTNIFQHFQLIADECVKSVDIMIYPGKRWIHQSGKGLKQFGYNQINDKTLESIDYYINANDIFDDSQIDDGISIVKKNKKKRIEKFEYSYYSKNNERPEVVSLESPGNNLISLNPFNEKIVNKLIKFVNKNNLRMLKESVLPRTLFGIESSFAEENAKKVKLLNEKTVVNYDKNIKLLTNDKSSSAGRARWYIADLNVISKAKLNYLNEWQVVVSSAHPGGQDGRDWQLEIIDNHSAFGRARVALKSFKTEKEAKNFYKYVSSDIIRFAFLMSDEALTSLAKVVPDIGDYTNKNNLVNFGKDIDEQLMDLTGITNKDMTYIRNVLN